MGTFIVRRPGLAAVVYLLMLVLLAALAPRHLKTSWGLTAVVLAGIACGPAAVWYFRRKLAQHREQAEVVGFSLSAQPGLLGFVLVEAGAAWWSMCVAVAVSGVLLGLGARRLSAIT
jgi:hypothetical protein